MNKRVINIGICDDNLIITGIVKEKCESFINIMGYDCQISCFNDGVTLLESDEKFELILLDVELPVIDGFEVARRLREKEENCCIVFLTSHYELFKQGYKVKAFRYLTKPIDDTELQEALQSYIEEKVKNEFLILNIEGREQLIYIKTILYIQSLRDESAIILIGNKPLIVKYTLKEWLTMLDSSHFVTPNRSYIVHLRHVKNVTKRAMILINKQEIKISIRRVQDVREQVHVYLVNRAHHLGGE